MSTPRTVRNEKELASALKERAGQIEIMGALAHTTVRMMTLDSLKWGGVVLAVGASLPILIWTGGVAVPIVAVAAASVVAVLGTVASVSVFWLAFYSGNLQALNALHVYKIACNSVSILVLFRPDADAPDYLPKVGTEVWDALNGRRIELIRKEIHGTLDRSERKELEELERLCDRAIDKAFPLPPMDVDGLNLLEARLRAEGGGHE